MAAAGAPRQLHRAPRSRPPHSSCAPAAARPVQHRPPRARPASTPTNLRADRLHPAARRLPYSRRRALDHAFSAMAAPPPRRTAFAAVTAPRKGSGGSGRGAVGGHGSAARRGCPPRPDPQPTAGRAAPYGAAAAVGNADCALVTARPVPALVAPGALRLPLGGPAAGCRASAAGHGGRDARFCGRVSSLGSLRC